MRKDRIKCADVKLAFCLDNRYLSNKDTQFVNLVTADLEDFKSHFLHKVVLLFPPVNNYLRLLIHKTVEDFPDLHSFSVGEGNQRQTVVCWAQALIHTNRDEEVSCDNLRPQGMRGRGRARFKGNNSPSPGPGHRSGSSNDVDRWSNDRYNHEPGIDRNSPSYADEQTRTGTMVTTRLPCQQSSDRSSSVGRQINEEHRTPVAGADNSSSRTRKADSRQKNRRPDVQVYVPRARRQPYEQNEVENHVTSGQSEVKSRSTPVRQKKKEIERYVPRGRLEQQNKEDSSSFHSIRNQAPTETAHEDKEVAVNSKNIHKKIRVDDELSVSHTGISTCVFTDQDFDTSKMSYDNSICDNKNVDVDKQTGDSSQIGNENFNENCENIPIHTSKYKDAFHDATISDYKLNKNDNSLNQEKDLLHDFNDLNSVPNPITPAIIKISSLDTANKLPEPQVSNSVTSGQSLIKETESIKEDTLDMNTADIKKDKPDEKSQGTTAGIELTNDTNICSVEGNKLEDVNLTHLKTEEELSECSNESALKVPSITSDVRTNNELDSGLDGYAQSADSTNEERGLKFSNSESDRFVDTESSIDDGLKKFSDDNGIGDEYMTDGTKSDKIKANIGSDKSMDGDERITVDTNVTNNRMELASGENYAQTLDCTNAYDDSVNKQDIESEDLDKSGNLIEQSNDVGEELETDKQTDCKSESITSNIKQSEDLSTVGQSNSVTNNSSQSKEEEVDEDSWDTMFDDDGECLDPEAMEELTKTVGKVKIQKSKKINYLDYQPKDKSNFDYTQYEHIIEIYDFPVDFVTRDLITAFQAFMSRGFDLKWVDDTHALGIFSSAIAAKDALQLMHPLLKVCPLSQASKQSQNKAKRCTEFLQPYKPRPETSAAAARRLVAGALGLATGVSKEKREMERKQLKEAKAKKRQERQNRENIWEYGKCAMDEES